MYVYSTFKVITKHHANEDDTKSNKSWEIATPKKKRHHLYIHSIAKTNNLNKIILPEKRHLDEKKALMTHLKIR